MKVNGIIAEYNPFHNGHQYQLQNALEQTNADYTVVVMSGDFIQRGAPAFLNKYTRAKIALENGADLVLELPSIYATSSAEAFALGAVTLFDKLGIITNLCFGSESGDISLIKKIASLLLDNSEEIQRNIQLFLKEGYTYPLARSMALCKLDPSLVSKQDLLASSNNILAIEYVKALLKRNSPIIPTTTKRMGSDYHSEDAQAPLCSATALRKLFFKSTEIDLLEEQMPQKAFSLLKDALAETSPLREDDFSSLLLYRLLMEDGEDFSRYLDVSKDLSNRIHNNLYQFNSFSSFCSLLKSKELTYTRISRCLLHILLDQKESDFAQGKEMDYIPYARILGLKKTATPLLHSLKHSTQIPIISKLADAKKLLTPNAYKMLLQDIRCSSIYEGVSSKKDNRPLKMELQQPIILVE